MSNQGLGLRPMEPGNWPHSTYLYPFEAEQILCRLARMAGLGIPPLNHANLDLGALSTTTQLQGGIHS